MEESKDKYHRHLQKTGEFGLLKSFGTAFHNVLSVALSPVNCSVEQTGPFLLFKAG